MDIPSESLKLVKLLAYNYCLRARRLMKKRKQYIIRTSKCPYRAFGRHFRVILVIVKCAVQVKECEIMEFMSDH
jgi:hypothetical protein